ncbi:hypothetical protein [Catenulispora subtropica]|uniref:Uncharacterized protein n=1 Tax=Catenulispora subtropica TaxID=450798 RepID=A0ABN2TF13_9ACTN
MTAYGDTGDIFSTRADPRRATGRTVTTVVGSRRQVRVRKSSSRKLRDLPELDLRTPSGRLLPF